MRKKYTPNQLAFLKEKRRIERYIKKMKKEGFFLDEEINLEMPKRVTKKKIDELKKINYKRLRPQLKYINKTDGSINKGHKSRAKIEKEFSTTNQVKYGEWISLGERIKDLSTNNPKYSGLVKEKSNELYEMWTDISILADDKYKNYVLLDSLVAKNELILDKCINEIEYNSEVIKGVKGDVTIEEAATRLEWLFMEISEQAGLTR